MDDDLDVQNGPNEPASGEDLLVLPAEDAHPTPRRKIALHTASGIRRELARLYRDARSGLVQTSDATRLGYLLDLLRKCLETSELERRLQTLELTLAARNRGAHDNKPRPSRFKAI